MNIISNMARIPDVGFSEYQLHTINPDEQRRIRLTNYIGLISMANMLGYTLVYCLIDFRLFLHAILVLIFSALITLGIIIINKKGKFLAAKILLASYTPLSMGYIAAYVFGNAPEFQVYLFVAAIIPLFLWNYRQRVYPIIIITIILITYAIIEFLPPVFQPKIVLPETYIYYFRLTNISVCFLAAGIAIATYQYLYRIKEEQLIKQTEELKISQAHKDKVYSIIAHDLRSPFGTFAGLTELFLDEYDEYSDEERLEIIQSMQKSSLSLQNLLENLLDWSKLQSGTLKKSLKRLNLRHIAEESLALHKELILKKEQKTSLNIDSDLMVYADHHMVSTIFRNLISNAVKFTTNHGEIAISAEGHKNIINICVKDSGVGLSESEIKDLFDIRNSDKIKEKNPGKGSGLGLLLCKDFIESLDGKLWIESEMSKGSKFCFTLPKSVDQRTA